MNFDHWHLGRGGHHGHGGPFGGRGGFMGRGFGGGSGFRAARMLASGDLQLIVLALLAEKTKTRLRDHQGIGRALFGYLYSESGCGSIRR